MNSLSSLALLFDHSLLHPTATDEEIRAGCDLAHRYGVATVCVKPYAVKMAVDLLLDSAAGVCAVVGFPHGNATTATKVREAAEAAFNGATEIDMVVNIGKLLGGDSAYVAREIKEVNETVVAKEAALKVIFENDFLDDGHIVTLCEVCSEIGVAYVKTSTGYGFVKRRDGSYGYAGAIDAHLKLMRAHCAPAVKIKAAGGIRTLDDALRVRALGVDRIGATATAAILDEAKKRGFRD